MAVYARLQRGIAESDAQGNYIDGEIDGEELPRSPRQDGGVVLTRADLASAIAARG